MAKEKRNIICALIAAVLAFSLFYGNYRLQQMGKDDSRIVKVGFIYDGDASTPYTANFIKATNQLRTTHDDDIEIIEKFNVPHESAAPVIQDLAEAGCDIIFTNSYGYGEDAKKMAEKYPEIQFCAATCDNAGGDSTYSNYHTFMGEIYQARYISGMVAGAKLNELIKNGTITKDQAKIGFIAAFPVAEVISGYTAFLLGARSQCPDAVMSVKYINTWNNYALENSVASQLIADGCIIISHHSNTIGSAIACEKASADRPVYHVAYNQDMMSVAPTVSLTSCRIDWAPYVISAVEAVIDKDAIESAVEGRIHGNDASGGFKEGWVKMFEVNHAAAAEGSKELVSDAIDQMSKGKIHVFKGDYTGVDPNDPNDTYDLNKEYEENKDSSAPTFHYVLKDVITIVD